MPVNLLHFWHGLLYAAIYIIFTVAFSFGTGTVTPNLCLPLLPRLQAIYPTLDWRVNPGTAGQWAAALGVGGTLVAWLIMYGLDKLMEFLARQCECGHVYPIEDGDDVIVKNGKDNLGYDNHGMAQFPA